MMVLWSRLSDALARLPFTSAVGSVVDRLVEAVRSLSGSSREGRELAFTIAMIALAAKMAKADGVVTADEVSVVKRLFVVPDAEKANVARLFNLAKQDVAGFEAYADRIRRLHETDPDLLEDILDGLFTIAAADGVMHEREDMFLAEVAQIFAVDERAFRRLRARHLVTDGGDPYLVLGVNRSMSHEEIKRAWRRAVSDNHPDRLHARGVPQACIKLATDRVAALNAAFDQIARETA